MKELAVVLSGLSLIVSVGLAVGAYVTYKKAENVINHPEQMIDKIVENKMNDLLKNLPLPKLPGTKEDRKSTRLNSSHRT